VYALLILLQVAFFSFISEFRDPQDFPKALGLLQCSDISMYLVSSVVIYYYAGRQVHSPALDSASLIVRKIAYGLAMPTIVIAGVVNGHVAVKYLFVRLLRDTKIFQSGKTRTKVDAEGQKDRFLEEEDLLHSKGWKAWAIWIGMVAVLWWVAWAISEGVPIFNDLVGLTSALFASWFTYGLSGMFFMHTNLQRKGWRVRWKEGVKVDWRKYFLLAVNVFCVVIGAVIVSIPLPILRERIC
jgi:Transmembrane amino acid transporter protein